MCTLQAHDHNPWPDHCPNRIANHSLSWLEGPNPKHAMNIYETTCRLRRLITHAWRLISCSSLCFNVLQWVMQQLCKSDPLCSWSHITVHSALPRTFTSNQITMNLTTATCCEDQRSKDQQAQDKLPSNSHGAGLELTCCHWKPESILSIALVCIVSQGVCWTDAICLFPSDIFLAFFCST